MSSAIVASAQRARPLTLVTAAALRAWLKKQSAATRGWLDGAGFAGKPGELALLPASGRGAVGAVFVFAEDGSVDDFWRLASLPARLPAASWKLESAHAPATAERIAMAWGIGGYQFTRYRKAARAPAKLVMPANADRHAVNRVVAANAFVRDLINTPAQDMGPAELADAAVAMAEELGMQARVVVGDKLLEEGHRLIHAVGRGSSRAPRLIDLAWGDAADPKITLVGKGVCFDSGGLDLKPADGMKLMKKDMGGAAHVLGLAQMIVRARLKVRLRVLVAAVENFVSGDSFRPLDVIASRKGLTVEIGNTDAEGRLILADALDLASEDRPDLIVDMATLTGAARVALGPELPATFCNDEATAAALARHAQEQADPLWRMPLWKPYRPLLDSKVADLNNISGGPMGGAVTAALFMQEFVGPGIPWVHLDVYAWNASGRPGRPEGAEVQALRALFALVAQRSELATS
jgi:leucyl aminopeptidase